MRFPHGITVTRLRAPVVSDGYGGTVRDWSDPDQLDRIEVDPCAVAPLAEDEQTQRGREGVADAWTLYAPYDADIEAHDRIEYDAQQFDIDGEPGRWRSPFSGTEFGMTVRIIRVEG